MSCLTKTIMTNSNLSRSTDKQLLGVAAGIADYFNIDTTLVRLLFILFTLMGGPGIIAYILMALLMPENNGVDSVFTEPAS